MKDELITVTELSKRMELPYSKVNLWIRQGIIPVQQKIGIYRMVDYREARRACLQKLRGYKKAIKLVKQDANKNAKKT